MKDLFTPLSETELESLDHFLLERIGDDVDTMDMDEGIIEISGLDGFLTAIVSGPVSLMPSQWLPVLWGDFAPAWETQQQAEQVMSMIMRHLNGVAVTLMEQPYDFEPIFYEREVEGKNYLIVDEWCEGYMRGVALAAEEWEGGGEELDALLLPILTFVSQQGWEVLDQLDDQEVETLQNTIAPNVMEIHAFWLARRSPDMPARQQPLRHETAPVGRNDPCPCGSGKKYKKCCLH